MKYHLQHQQQQQQQLDHYLQQQRQQRQQQQRLENCFIWLLLYKMQMKMHFCETRERTFQNVETQSDLIFRVETEEEDSN